MGFTDIHAHILPGLDDGAADLEESLRMLRMAAADGVTTVAATPHCGWSGLYENYAGPETETALRNLCSAVREAGIPVEICRGAEVYVTEETAELLFSEKLFTLNGSRYLLVEFDFHESPAWCTRMLRKLRDLGCVPVVAHPERYFAVWREPWCIYPWLDMGCHVQVNRGSLLGAFGPEARQAAMYLLDRNLVACVASDAHSSRHRTLRFRDVHTWLSERYAPDYADMLLKENPERILLDRPLLEE